ACAGARSGGRGGAAPRRAARAPRPARPGRRRGPWSGRARRGGRAVARDRRRRRRWWKRLVASWASVQEIAVLVDVGGEIERVLPHQALGELGVALFE